jgi:hypothetical protein
LSNDTAGELNSAPTSSLLVETSPSARPTINFSSDEWDRIEKAYRRSLPPDVRADIVQAMEEFLFFERVERTASSLAEVKVIVEAYDKAAGRFLYALFTDPSGSSDASVYAHELIERHSEQSRSGSQTAIFDVLLTLLRGFHIACNASLKQLNDPSLSASKIGNAWELWVLRLTEIMKKVKIRPSEQKDVSSKSSDQSSFVTFVWELQKYLPGECRRYAHSEAGLADAIREVKSQARKVARE